VGAVIAAAEASNLAGIVGDLPLMFVLSVAVVAVAAFLTVAIVVALSKRRLKDAQDIVMLLEEMRSGRVRTRLELDQRSPFASIAESANRLGQDLGVRWSRAENANEAFYALQEAARGYAVIATDGDGDLRALSAGAEQLFGWEEDAVIGRNAALLFDPASWKELVPKLARKSLRDRGVESRVRMARRDKSHFEARLFVRALRGHADEPSGFLLVVQDLTEQVKVETEARAVEGRSRGILEGLPAGVALLEQGRIVYANPIIRDLLELPEGDVTGFPLRDRVATSHVLFVQDALAKLEAGSGKPTLDTIVTLRDASGRPSREVRVFATAQSHEGRPAVVIVLRDETAERRLVRTLAAEEKRLSAVLDAWDDAVLLIEDDALGSRVRLANRAFVALFALSREDVAGVTETDLMRALRERGDEGAAAASCLAAGRAGPSHDTIETANRSLSLWAAPLFESSGRGRLRMLAIRDVTAEQARRHAQGEEARQWQQRHETVVASYASLRSLHDELTESRAQAEKLNTELRTLDGMKSDLLANVSHELQTPLVSVRGYTEMILKERLGAINDEQRKGLTLSLKNIDRLIAMIDNLLAFARMDRESGELSISTFALASVVDEALALLGEKIEAKSLRVTRNLDEPELTVRADRDKILQVFLNLIGNAVKFSRDRGSIEVSARPGKPGFALVQVCDTGVGIAKENLERIFDRFYQAGDGGDPKPQGTGIGLAIVRNILRLHGCVIQATSELGQGTVLSFTLPLAEERTEQQREAPPGGTPQEPPRDLPQPPAPPKPKSATEPAKRGEAERPRLRIIRRG
jgi:PAS domain S-box-containing protein